MASIGQLYYSCITAITTIIFALTLLVDQIGLQHQVKENEKKGESAKDSSHAFGKNIITLIKWSHQFVIQIRSALIN